jgi:hypothetical protein
LLQSTAPGSYTCPPAQRLRVDSPDYKAAKVEAWQKAFSRFCWVAEADPISYASGVTLSGFAAIAAPIFDEAQRLRYALTLIYRTERHQKRKDEFARLTAQAANRASHLAGALDERTGQELWKTNLSAAAFATPMTYSSARIGRQYVVVAVGGNSKFGPNDGLYVEAYALP